MYLFSGSIGRQNIISTLFIAPQLLRMRHGISANRQKGCSRGDLGSPNLTFEIGELNFAELILIYVAFGHWLSVDTAAQFTVSVSVSVSISVSVSVFVSVSVSVSVPANWYSCNRPNNLIKAQMLRIIYQMLPGGKDKQTSES